MKSTAAVFVALLAIVVEIHGNILMETIEDTNKKSLLSTGCRSALELYANNWKNSPDNDPWALKMWDATSKIPVGLISYNFGDMGNYDQCLDTKSEYDNIMPKYCLGRIKIISMAENDTFLQKQIFWKELKSFVAAGIKTNINPTWAICTPSNCTDKDVLTIVNGMQDIGIGFESVQCQTWYDLHRQLTTDAVIGITIFSLIAVIMALSTSYDLYCCFKKTDPIHPMFIAFSIKTNGRKIFNMKNYSGELQSLNGIRCLCMTWIFIGHTKIYRRGPLFNLKYSQLIENSVFMIFFNDLTYPVDTFLMIGGMLVTYVYFKRRRNEEKLNIFKHYFHRYIRLTPPIAGIVLMNATFMAYLSSGPLWQVDEPKNDCKKYWWATFLYIQNYYNADNMCNGHTWYLNVDMQLFLFSPLILYLLKTKPKTAITILGLLSLALTLVGFWIMYDEELYPSSHKYFTDYHIKTHTKAAPWLIGNILGYLLARDGSKPRNISKVASTLLWIATFIVMAICIYSYHIFGISENDILGNAFLVALRTPVWCICLWWMIWACTTDHGVSGGMNSLLSNPVFHFFGQFTYSLYLLHVLVMPVILLSRRTAFYYSIMNLVYSFGGLFMISFGISVVWVLTFERPILVLEKIIFEQK